MSGPKGAADSRAPGLLARAKARESFASASDWPTSGFFFSGSLQRPRPIAFGDRAPPQNRFAEEWGFGPGTVLKVLGMARCGGRERRYRAPSGSWWRLCAYSFSRGRADLLSSGKLGPVGLGSGEHRKSRSSARRTRHQARSASGRSSTTAMRSVRASAKEAWARCFLRTIARRNKRWR